METERKTRLVQQIKAAHPSLTVRTSWCVCDFDLSGIEIHARNAASGCTLADSRTDEKLDGMSDEAVSTWVNESMQYHLKQQKQARHRIAVERQMNQE